MEERKNIFDFDEHAPTVIKTENEVYEFDKKENQNIVFDKDKTNIDILVCQCGDVNHQLVFTYWPADKNLKDEPQVYVDIHLVKSSSIFKRIKIALKYIFGKPCKYGSFDEVILRPEDYQKLENVVTYLKTSYLNILKEKKNK